METGVVTLDSGNWEWFVVEATHHPTHQVANKLVTFRRVGSSAELMSTRLLPTVESIPPEAASELGRHCNRREFRDKDDRMVRIDLVPTPPPVGIAAEWPAGYRPTRLRVTVDDVVGHVDRSEHHPLLGEMEQEDLDAIVEKASSPTR